jgi:hypothetical protein
MACILEQYATRGAVASEKYQEARGSLIWMLGFRGLFLRRHWTTCSLLRSVHRSELELVAV